MRPSVSVFLLVLWFGLAAETSAQNDRWQAFPSFRNVQTISASGDALWAGTEGGVYRYALASGEIERFTPVQGLSRVDVQAIAYDEARDAVWVGYADGVLDRLDASTGEVRPFFDIAQADRYSARGINRIEVVADSLLISTGFGVVVFDATRDEVSDTYERFGTFPSGTAVGDVLLAPRPDGGPGLWVGTREGVAYASLDAPNLREPSAWTIDAQAPDDVLSLGFFAGAVYAGTEQIRDDGGGILEPGGGFRRLGNGGWEPFTGADRSFWDLLVVGDELVAVTVFQVLVVDAGGNVRSYRIPDTGSFQAGTVGPDGQVWAGSGSEGLIAYPSLAGLAPGTVEAAQRVIPVGPLTNAIQDLAVDVEGSVWLGFQSFNATINGFARYDGTAWTNFSLANGALPDRATIRTVHADARGNVWFGTEGRGVFQYAPEGEITLYTTENSSLRQSSSDPNYIVAVGLASDDEDRLWVTNRFASPPLHVRTPEGEWVGIERPNGVPSAVRYDEIYIDTFGQKWISGFNGGGLIVLDTGSDPLDAGDDRAAYVGTVGSSSEGTGLPDTEVNVVVEDRSGRMWLGTNRGLATVFSPGSAFSGNLASQITWARTPDGASYFLRDLRIFDIAVDPANRKWLASSSGVWLLNAEGDEVLANFTTENSPLPSDVVVAVTVDEESGVVHFATSGGLYSYEGDAVAAAPVAEELFVYPNPVRGNGGALPEIAIEGLVDDADVRVLTIDGQVVASFRTRGGSVRWDGRDERTGAFVPSGVYIVTAAGQDGEGTAYGKIAVIR